MAGWARFLLCLAVLATLARASQSQTVHVVFGNHLDIGEVVVAA